VKQSICRPVCFLASLVVLFASEVLVAEEPAPVTPDLAAVQQESLKLAAEAKKRHYSDFSSKVESVEFLSIKRARNLLPRKTEHEWPRPFIYIVHMFEHTEWYKHSLQYIFVLRVEDGGFTPLLMYCGGLNESTLKYEELHLGDRKVFEKEESTSTAYPFDTLYIEDWSSGTGSSQERVLLFRYDEERGHFYNIFDQIISFTPSRPSPQAYDDYRSTVEFRNDKHPLKDIVVTCEWPGRRKETFRELSGKDSICERCVSIFKWNGQRYEGVFGIPEKAHSSRNFWRAGKWYPIAAE